jgi:D-alanyl-D-alanine carboxypeptidase
VRQLHVSRARRIPARFTAVLGLALSAGLAVVLATPALSQHQSGGPSAGQRAADQRDPAATSRVLAATPGPSRSPAPTAGAETGGGVGTRGWLNLANLDVAPIPSGDLTRALGALRSQYAVPGISATIIWPDGRSWTATSGFADVTGKVRLTRNTAFAVASVTKTFVAALVLQLAQEGRLGLDDALLAWLPEARVDPRVTIRQLLDHTSGVYDFFSNSAIDAPLRKARSAAWTPARALSYVKAPYFQPGTGWHYSNTGYVLLGQLVERVTGNSWASEVRTRFLDPLKLGSAFVQGAEKPRGPISHGYRFTSSSRTAKPIDLWDRTGIVPFRSVVTAAGSAGAIAASSWDLARWTRALYGGQLLTAPALGTMLDFASSARHRNAVPYGMGVQQYTIGGRTAYGHGGRLMGARAAIRYVASEGISIAVVVNTDRADPAVIASSLLSVALPPLPPPAPTPPPTVAPTSSPAAPPVSAPASPPIVPAPPFASTSPSVDPQASAAPSPSN